MIQQIKDKAKELLESKAVTCVIGYERATDGITARPAFIYEASEVERLIFDQTCVHNLARYLLNKRHQPSAIIAKPCDSRAINVLLNEKQLQRDKIFVIGIVCQGVVQVKWNKVDDILLPKCQSCSQHMPAVYDFLVGEQVTEPSTAITYSDIQELERKSAAERQAFWKKHFNRCIRCYACRQVCPGCYCQQCFVEQLDPLWVGIRIAADENEVWNTIRAFHLAARCISCGDCERVCPVNIPLMLLNRKLEKDTKELFHFEAGLKADETPPFATFAKEEELGSENG